MKSREVLAEEERAEGDGFVPDFPAASAGLPEAPSVRRVRGSDLDAADVWTAHAPVTREFLRQLRRAAEQDAPVYLYGEPGSGRMCAARTLCRWREEWDERGRPGRTDGRLPVAILRVPSLRERPLDLPEIAVRCLVALARDHGRATRWLTPRALEALLAREWRGNIIELHSVLERAVQRAGDRLAVDADDLPPNAEPVLRPSQLAKDAAQRDCLLRQLRFARTVSAAAKREGCTRANYVRLMRRLGILRADCVGRD